MINMNKLLKLLWGSHVEEKKEKRPASHSHVFTCLDAMYEEVFQKIIVEHNLEHHLILHCKCGEPRKAVISLNFQLKDAETLIAYKLKLQRS